MNLIDAYRTGKRLSFARTRDFKAERILTAMVEVPDGLAVSDGNVLDPWASKASALLTGKISGDGPWTVGDWTVELVEGDDIMTRSWDQFEELTTEGWRDKVEEWLKETYS